MKKIAVAITVISLLGSLSWAESITNDLTSSTVGFWTLGTPPPTTGSPEAAPTGYNDADYVTVPIGTPEFSWQTLDGADGEGTVAMWIYDANISSEAADLGHGDWGPRWGVRSSGGGAPYDLTIGIRRKVWAAWERGHYVATFPYTFGGGAWFVDGTRASKQIPYQAGWYKWGFIAHIDFVRMEVYDIDFFDTFGTQVQIHGTAVRTFDSSFSKLAHIFTAAAAGWNGLSFTGDNPLGPEDFNIALAGGNGVFAGVGEETELPLTTKNISSWGAVKALYR